MFKKEIKNFFKKRDWIAVFEKLKDDDDKKNIH